MSGIFLIYAVTYGFLVPLPDMEDQGALLANTIRNLFFHVGMWFTMLILFTMSFAYSLRYLRGFDEKYDAKTIEAVNTGLLFGFLGIITGMIWAKSDMGQLLGA